MGVSEDNSTSLTTLCLLSYFCSLTAVEGSVAAVRWYGCDKHVELVLLSDSSYHLVREMAVLGILVYSIVVSKPSQQLVFS